MKNPDKKVNIVFQLVKRKACEVSNSYMDQRQSMVAVYPGQVAFFFLLPHMARMVSTPGHRLLKN